METVKNAFDAIKEYVKYSKSHTSTPGIVLSVALLAAGGLFLSVSLVTAATQNLLFGIISGVVATLFLLLLSLMLTEKVVKRLLPAKKSRYLFSLRLKRLYSLDEDAFYYLALREAEKKTGKNGFSRDGIFFSNGEYTVAFSAKPGNKASLDVINQAKKLTSNKIIAVVAAEDKKRAGKAFDDVVFITDGEIALSSDELDYEEIKEKKRIVFSELITEGVAKRLLTSGFFLILLSFITGINGVFMKMAVVSVLSGIAFVAIGRKNKKAIR